MRIIYENIIDVTEENLVLLKNNPKKFWKNVERIGNRAFCGLLGLTEIEIPPHITHIWDDVFMGCSNLKKVRLSEGLEHIGDSAFFNCVNLTKINLPNTLKEIASEAFYGCKSLTEITIPASVERMGICVFSECDSLRKITFKNTKNFKGDLGETLLGFGFNTCERNEDELTFVRNIEKSIDSEIE